MPCARVQKKERNNLIILLSAAFVSASRLFSSFLILNFHFLILRQPTALVQRVVAAAAENNEQSNPGHVGSLTMCARFHAICYLVSDFIRANIKLANLGMKIKTYFWIKSLCLVVLEFRVYFKKLSVSHFLFSPPSGFLLRNKTPRRVLCYRNREWLTRRKY